MHVGQQGVSTRARMSRLDLCICSCQMDVCNPIKLVPRDAHVAIVVSKGQKAWPRRVGQMPCRQAGDGAQYALGHRAERCKL